MDQVAAAETTRSQPPDPAVLLNQLRRELPKAKASLAEVEVLSKIIWELVTSQQADPSENQS